MTEFRKQVRKAVAITFGPPLLLVALYLSASATGCSGGDCTGAMLALGIVAIPLLLLSIGGAGILLILLVSELGRRTRRSVRARLHSGGDRAFRE